MRKAYKEYKYATVEAAEMEADSYGYTDDFGNPTSLFPEYRGEYNMANELNRKDMMYWYLKMCCKYDLIKLLKSFSNGIGYSICETMMVFGDDPDENDPNQDREFPELAEYCGVGFFNEHYPEPFLVSYQDFYDELSKQVLEYSESKDLEYRKNVEHYLSLIRERYNLIDNRTANKSEA